MSFMFLVLCSTILTEIVIFVAPDKRACYLGITGLSFINFVFSGLFIKAQSLPVWMRSWVPVLSIIRWNMQANFINNYENDTVAFPIPIAYQTVLNLFGWGGKTKWYCFYILLLFIFIYKMIGLWASSFGCVIRKGGRRAAST